MRNAQFIIFSSVVTILVLAGSAMAGTVRVFKPMEKDVSRMELRNQAMAEGFAQAVLEDAQLMLSGELGEVRTELFKQYLVDHAKPFIEGYKVLSSQDMEAGLILNLDVKVNKKSLRDGLKNMGLFATTIAPQAATVVWPENMDEEDMTKLQGLITLTGLQVGGSAYPSFSLEIGPEHTFKARFALDDREWVATNKDMASLWFELWGRFFTRSELKATQTKAQTLSVSGWFSPDAVLEFDRVLRSWDSSVQEVQMVEMDMQPTGVGGVWELRILNHERFNVLLQGFLPQRGLSFQLSEDATK